MAELEATAVRKGNRKVSVKLSGQVNRGILFWDDGHDDDIYYVDNNNSSTRFRITGSATISPGRTAGFRIEADWFIQNNSSVVSNCDDDTRSAGGATCKPVPNIVGDTSQSLTGITNMRWQEVWIKLKKFGKFSLGQGDTASNNTSHIDLSGTKVAQGANWTNVGRKFVFRSATGAFTTQELRDVYNDHDGLSRRVRLRYDTPVIGGFTFSTSTGADDFVDGALRFKKEWNSVRCAWAGGFAHDTNEENVFRNGVRVQDDLWIYSTSGSCMHTPSGLNLTLGYSETDEGVDDVDVVYARALKPLYLVLDQGLSANINQAFRPGVGFSIEPGTTSRCKNYSLYT